MTPFWLWLAIAAEFVGCYVFMLVLDRILPDVVYQPASVRTQIEGEEPMTFTHYIPAFTEVRNGKQVAVCGDRVSFRAHSAEPTCPDCKAWLDDEEGRAFLQDLADLDADVERLREARR